MIKRLVSVLLFAATLLCVPVCVSAEPVYHEDYINVCHNGVLICDKVLVDDKETIYGSNDWICYYGRYVFNETDTDLEYYYKDQEKLAKYAKRIFIDKTTGEYKVCVYRGKGILDLFLDSCADYVKEYIESKPYSEELENFIKKKYKKDYDACVEEFKALKDGFKILKEGKFSKFIVHEGNVWMPIEELLPLLGAHVDVFDKALQIKNVTTSIWQALYGFDMEELGFVGSDELFGEEVTTPLAWVTTSLVDWRFDRLDVIDQSGDINDYKDIFKSYMLDDEVYLKCFGGDDDIVTETDKKWAQLLNEMEGFDFFKGAVEFDLLVNQITNFMPTGMSEVIEESAGLDITADILKFSSIIGNYVYAYMNQVEDHRMMLEEMYEDCFAQSGGSGGEIYKRRNCPSYKAAIDVSNTYSGEVRELLEAIIEDIKDEFDTKFIKDFLLGKMKPAIVIYDSTIGIMKVFGDYGELENMAHAKKVDKICKTAVDCFEYARGKNDYSKGWLNRVRLMGIMAALSSRNAYDTYAWHQTDKIKALEEHLIDLYMAAESIPLCEKNYFKDASAKIKSKYKDLPLLGGSGQTESKRHYEIYQFIEMTFDKVLKLGWDSFQYKYEKGSDEVEMQAVYGDSYLEIYASFSKPSDYLTEDYEFDPADFMVHTVTIPETAPDGAYIAYGIRKGMTFDEMAALLAVADMKMPLDVHETEDTSQLPFGTTKYGYIYPKNCLGYINYHVHSREGYKIKTMTANFDPWV